MYELQTIMMPAYNYNKGFKELVNGTLVIALDKEGKNFIEKTIKDNSIYVIEYKIYDDLYNEIHLESSFYMGKSNFLGFCKFPRDLKIEHGDKFYDILQNSKYIDITISACNTTKLASSITPSLSKNKKRKFNISS